MGLESEILERFRSLLLFLLLELVEFVPGFSNFSPPGNSVFAVVVFSGEPADFKFEVGGFFELFSGFLELGKARKVLGELWTEAGEEAVFSDGVVEVDLNHFSEELGYLMEGVFEESFDEVIFRV